VAECGRRRGLRDANPYTGKPRALIPCGRAADAERLARIEVTDNGKLISETLD
jgi:hypothetical protein